MATGEKAPVPPQDGVGAYQQPQPVQRLPRQRVQQGSDQGPVGGGKPYPLLTQLPL
jgi:hypothetical protein